MITMIKCLKRNFLMFVTLQAHGSSAAGCVKALLSTRLQRGRLLKTQKPMMREERTQEEAAALCVKYLK